MLNLLQDLYSGDESIPGDERKGCSYHDDPRIMSFTERDNQPARASAFEGVRFFYRSPFTMGVGGQGVCIVLFISDMASGEPVWFISIGRSSSLYA